MVHKRLVDETATSKNQCTVSFELLTLLQWLAAHEEPMLKKIINHALHSGLNQHLHNKTELSQQALTETIQYSIVEFFALLETLLLEALDEQTVHNAIEHKLMPAIDRIDISTCDNDTIRMSVEKTTAHLSKDQRVNAQEMLFKELLKQWRPTKKAIKH